MKEKDGYDGSDHHGRRYEKESGDVVGMFKNDRHNEPINGLRQDHDPRESRITGK